MKSTALSSACIVALAGPLLLGSAGAGFAAEPTESNTSVIAQEAGSLAAESISTFTQEPESSKAILTKLNDLKGTQTSAEIKAILSSPGPAELLLDPVQGRYVAAYTTGAVSSTEAITFSGPGCSTTSACLVENGTTYLGYNGRGVLSGLWRNVTRLQAGSYTSYFGYSTTRGHFVSAGKAVNLTSPVTYVELSR